MVLAYHSIFGMYGFWLPNDPRGSGSDYVGALNVLRFGSATKVNTRHSVASREHDTIRRELVYRALSHPRVAISGKQAVVIATGFATAIEQGNYRLFACAIMPEHVHLVVECHARPVRQIVGHLKSRATQQLRAEGDWPNEQPLWGAHGWNVPLGDVSAVRRAIAYVEDNPVKEGMKRQKWSMVTPFVPQQRVASDAARRRK
jgi:REP element-mobilizing transposase RayT